MNRKLAALLAAPLILTGCASEPEPQPVAETTTKPNAVEYPSMIEWYEAMDSEQSPITCQERESKSPPLIKEAKYQVTCTDQTGREANLIIFDNLSDMADRIGTARSAKMWKEGEWKILRGTNWTVDCVTDEQCDLWQSGFGGKIISASDFGDDLIVEETTITTPTETAPPEPATTFTDGTHMVGSDIQPGTYRNEGNETCYWARLSGFGGTVEDIIANDNPRGQTFVTIGADDVAFKSQLCGTWELVE